MQVRLCLVFTLSIFEVFGILKSCFLLVSTPDHRETGHATNTVRSKPTKGRKDSLRSRYILAWQQSMSHPSPNSHATTLHLTFFSDNKAVIKEEVPTRRRVSRSHRVALDSVFDRLILDSKTQRKMCRNAKPIGRHFDQRALSLVTNGTTFFVCSILCAIQCSCSHFSKRLDEPHAMSKRPVQNNGNCSAKCDGWNGCDIVIRGVDKDRWVTVRENAVPLEKLQCPGG